MKREDQVFKGELKDKELYLIEAALNGRKVGKKKANELIMKLYQNFHESGKKNENRL